MKMFELGRRLGAKLRAWGWSPRPDKPRPLPPPTEPDHPPLVTLADLSAAIEEAGFAAVSERILERAIPVFHIVSEGPLAEAPVGATRLGGDPDLPATESWPRDEAGLLGSFIGQIDLAALADDIGPTELPPSGLLSFFVMGMDCGSSVDACRVIWTPAGTNLSRVIPPAGEAFGEPGIGRLQPIGIRFVSGVTLPLWDDNFVDGVHEAEPEGVEDDLHDRVSARPAGAIGRLLGDVEPWVQGDFQRSLHLESIGRSDLESYRYGETWEQWEAMKQAWARDKRQRRWNSPEEIAERDGQARWVHANLAELKAGERSWRLLLSVDSNEEMQLHVNDYDPLFFFLKDEALARRAFSEAAVRAEQS